MVVRTYSDYDMLGAASTLGLNQPSSKFKSI